MKENKVKFVANEIPIQIQKSSASKWKMHVWWLLYNVSIVF